MDANSREFTRILTSSQRPFASTNFATGGSLAHGTRATCSRVFLRLYSWPFSSIRGSELFMVDTQDHDEREVPPGVPFKLPSNTVVLNLLGRQTRDRDVRYTGLMRHGSRQFQTSRSAISDASRSWGGRKATGDKTGTERFKDRKIQAPQIQTCSPQFIFRSPNLSVECWPCGVLNKTSTLPGP